MSVKLQLRLDSSEDADPASTAFSYLVERAEPAFTRALCDLLPEGTLPAKVEISLSFLSLGEMKAQNRKYRGLDEPTDVLSFPLWEEDGVFRPGRSLPTLPLGDILICPEYVRAAVSSEEEFQREMALMLAHGFLHLLGWDHDTDERRSAMEVRQELIRKELLAFPEGAASGTAEEELR
jgi:probable rRNA maturation factor